MSASPQQVTPYGPSQEVYAGGRQTSAAVHSEPPSINPQLLASGNSTPARGGQGTAAPSVDWPQGVEMHQIICFAEL
ncbi:hypothetical protein AURDEDRAFT_165744 [Auricularia subglabra TFB-10046 SS5]|nr:hypothetical protein AURDEDRAFT_165744 [Auricularia subglabra TFB-10046 SS5]